LNPRDPTTIEAGGTKKKMVRLVKEKENENDGILLTFCSFFSLDDGV
jgi:hypothetical protein